MPEQFSKVLAANRGEIAIRIFRACYDLELHTVAMYSKEDELSMFRTRADEAYLVGENKSPLGAYLDIPEIIDLAKRRGVDVTCETAPHYLTFTDEDLQEDGRFKMNPPLRAREDRDALIEGLLDGTIDMLVTDHAPHSREEKARGLEKSAMGVVGLETSFAASYTALVQTGILPLEKLVDLMHGAPMRRFGCGTELAEGQPADLTAFDLTKTYTVDPETFLTMGRATPFAGRALTGVCKLTMIGGEPVWKEETL